MNASKAQHKNYIDILRCFATVAVVFAHCNSVASLHNYILYLISFCVPTFIMITGALLLNPEKEVTTEKIFKKYILKTVLIIVVFGFIYNIASLTMEEGFSVLNIYKSLKMVLLADTKYCYHFWYLYALLGFYLLIPILKPWVAKTFSAPLNKWDKVFFYLIIVIAIVLPPVLEYMGISSWLGFVFPQFTAYAVLLVVGYVVDKYGLSKSSKIIMLVIFALGGAAYFYVTLRNYDVSKITKYFDKYKYQTIFAFSYSLLLFDFAKRIDDIKNKALKFVVNIISKHSLRIYIFHVAVIMVLRKSGLNETAVPELAYPFIVALCAIVISVICSVIFDAFVSEFKKLLINK